jgi:hypothetical protein
MKLDIKNRSVRQFLVNVKILINLMLELTFILPFAVLCILSRMITKKYDIGIGPEPFVSHLHHQKALELYGYSVQTFVDRVYYITEKFDIRGDKVFKGPLFIISPYFLLMLIIFRYRAIYIYFNGGPLGLNSSFFFRYLEPFFLKLAGVKTVVMPYGSDIQILSRSPNLMYKFAVSQDYPYFMKNSIKKIDRQIYRWTKHADHVISGCDWVYYMYHWNTLMISHFSIDTDELAPVKANESADDSVPNNGDEANLTILHAPNHRNIKGSRFFIQAVEELRNEGFPVELVIAEKISNQKVKELMQEVDIIADQLIIGWYAMFAIEGMSLEKPVLCYIDDNLEELFITAGLLEENELPLVKCKPSNIKSVIKDLALNREQLTEIGKRSREFVIKHHSLEYIGGVFNKINIGMGITPSKTSKK